MGKVNKDKEPDRGHWKHSIEPILSLIGFCIGMGSLWRFPYLVMRNGGGAFLIPYVFFTLFIGIPALSLETALGQYFQLSPLLIFDICPLFKGLGVSITLLAFLAYLYYMVILSWILYFLAMSFAPILPWSSCENVWNTESCQSVMNITNSSSSNQTGVLSTEEFWRFSVLDISSGIEETGNIRWQLLLSMIVAFLLIYVCIFKGVVSSRIAIYITATVPYALLIGLLVWLLNQSGSDIGLRYFITPRWNKVAKFQTWLEAFLQVFYSLGPGLGSVINLSSFNNPNQNCLRDSIIVAVMDALTSVLCGAVVFAGVGCIAYQTDSPVEELISTGPSLAFVTYPQVVASMPLPHAWAALFFLLILFLGLDSQFVSVKTVASGITDIYPKTLTRFQPLLVFALLLVSLVLTLPFVTQGGFYLFHIVDWYLSFFTILTIVVCECVVITWIYGADRFLGNIKEMVSSAPPWYIQFLKYCWKIVVPFCMMSVLFLAMVKFRSPTYGAYVYPRWTNVLGWCLALSTSIPIPVVMIYKLSTTRGTFSERLTKCTQPIIGRGGKKIGRCKLKEMDEFVSSDVERDLL